MPYISWLVNSPMDSLPLAYVVIQMNDSGDDHETIDALAKAL